MTKPTAVIISNNHRNSAAYTSGMMGYGYQIEESKTFIGARVMLKSGLDPALIVVDVTLQEGEIREFLHFVRNEMGITSDVIVIDNMNRFVTAGATTCLPRPTHLDDILHAARV